jgi:hypothetical protein
MDNKKQQYEDAMIGEDAEKFLLSPLGERIIELVEAEEKAAIEALIKHEDDPVIQKQARRTIDTTRSFSGYLQAIITQGQMALQQLEQEKNHD